MRLGTTATCCLLQAVVLFAECGPAFANHEAELALIDALIESGDYDNAEHSARDLLERIDPAGTSDSIHTAEVLDTLVHAINLNGRWPPTMARAYAQRAVAIKESIYGPDHPSVADSLIRLGNAIELIEQITERGNAYERALQIRRRNFGEFHPATVESLYYVARMQFLRNDPENGMRNADRALEMAEQLLGPEHHLVADIMVLKASRLRDYDAAMQLLRRAIDIQEAHYGPQHPLVANTLFEIGALRWFSTELNEARSTFEKTLAIRESRLRRDHRNTAKAANALANVLSDLGDLDAANRLYNRALGIYERETSPDSGSVSTILQNLGANYVMAGDYDGALHLLERALIIREGFTVEGLPNGPAAMTMYHLGGALRELGEYELAAGHYEKALAIFEQDLAMPDNVRHADSADPANYISVTAKQYAELRYRMGDFEEAKNLYDRSLEVTSQMFGPEHPDTIPASIGLAKVLAKTGETEVASTLALQTENLSREHRRLVVRLLPERQALGYATSDPAALDIALSIAKDRHPGDPATAMRIWDAIVRGRAVVLDEMAARHRAAKYPGDAVTRRLDLDVRRAREQLAGLLVRGPKDGPVDAYQKEIDTARKELEQAERQLAKHSLSFRQQIDKEDAGASEILRSIGETTAIISFLRFDNYQFSNSTKDGYPVSPRTEYVAVVAGASAEPELAFLGEAQTIDELVSRLREQVADVGMDVTRVSGRSERLYRQTGVELRKRIWDPIAPSVANTKQIFIVADGALNALNFAAIPVSGTRYLVEENHSIHYLSAERDLITGETQTGQGMLAIGNPDFDTGILFADAQLTDVPEAAPTLTAVAATAYRGQLSSCADFQSALFDPLPASSIEIEQVIALWNGEISDRDSIVHLSDTTASETAFKMNAAGKQILHLATHGFFLGGKCASALDSKGNSVNGENPLILSGLALAGANQRTIAGPGEDDGILTSEEIASLDLDGVEWAVLSACDTGLGEIRSGEGVLGLRRAFQIAGVRTLIMSLWAVQDEAARDWMQRLYSNRFSRGLATAEAAHQASLDTLRARRAAGASTHPFFWAGFVAVGDWR